MSGKIAWWKLNLIIVVIGCSSVVEADETTYTLAYKFQTGQFYFTEGQDRGEMIMQDAKELDREGNPREERISQHTQKLSSFRVVTTDENGGAVLEPIVEKVRMASKAADQPVIRYDSVAGDIPPKMFEVIAGTLGRPLARFSVASNGRLLKVALLVKDVPKGFSEAAEKTDPAINFLVVLPDSPVKIGDKWNEKFEMPVLVGNKLTQKMKLIKSYELTKVEDNVATIRVRTNLLTPTEDPEILRQLAQMISIGIIEFDMQQGIVLSKTIRFDEKVIGAFGAQTLLHARGESTEKTSTTNPATQVANGKPDSPNPQQK